MAEMLAARDLLVLRGGQRVLDGVDLTVEEGEALALLGERGSGRTTLAQTLLGMLPHAGGMLRLDRQVLPAEPPHLARRRRAALQYLPPDPATALDPRWTIGRTLLEGMQLHGVGAEAERLSLMGRMLRAVGLGPVAAEWRPAVLSPDSAMRVGLARLLLLRPRLLMLDEPTEGLDLPAQAELLRLLATLRDQFGMAVLLITRDPAVACRISDRLAVMQEGRVVEQGPTATLLAAARHPCTRALLAAPPRLDGRPPRAVLPDGPLLASVPAVGCRFHPRCPAAELRCAEGAPPVQEVTAGHSIACHRWRELG